MELDGKNGTIYEFGDFRLIPAEELLLRNGEPVPLNAKALRVLVHLVERHGHLVEKSEILDLVWEDSFVEEGSLSKAIWYVRHALNDTSKERYIQTIPKRGYRFVAPVRILNNRSSNGSSRLGHISTGYRLPILPKDDEIDREITSRHEPRGAIGGSSKVVVYAAETEALRTDESTEKTVASQEFPLQAPSTERPLFGRFRTLVAYTGVAVVLLGGVAVYLTFTGSNILGKGDSRIAVLPFKPLNAETRDPVYELGMADSLIVKIGSAPKLTVRQLSAVRHYLGLDLDAIKIGKEQNVDYVLSSHYQIANSRIKVTSQLMDVATGKVEDTFNVEMDGGNLFSAQEAVANEIGNRLLARFGSESAEVRSKRRTNNEEAYRNYQQAMTLLDQQRPGSIDKAREYLDRAVELDPNYARAWAGKAYANSVMWTQHRPSDPEDPDVIYERSMEAAKRALAIDPNLSDAYTSLCENKFAYELNYNEAERDCKRAIDLDPNSPLAHRMYSTLLRSRGRFDEAFAEIKTAMELEPVSLRNQRVFANTLYYARRWEEAIEAYKRLFDLNPDTPQTHFYLIRCLERQGRESEALESLIRQLVLHKKDDATIERFRAAYASSGWRGVLKERINTELQEKSPQYSVVAEHYGLLGDKDKAFEYLQKNLPKRGWMKMFFRVDPRFDPLRGDPRFDDLIRRVEGK